MGSINKAAECLFMTQPNLTKAIKNLEDELKIKIFIRSNKGVKLTLDGEKLYLYSKTLVSHLELIQGISKENTTEELRITSYPLISISQLISEFFNLNKNLKIKLTEERILDIVRKIEIREADIGFVMINNIQEKEFKQMISHKNIEYKVLGTDTWYINIGEKNPFYNSKIIDIRDLIDYTVVRLPDDYFSNLTYYLKIDNISLTCFKKTIHIGDSFGIIKILQNTDAFRFGPKLSEEEFKKYGIRTIPIKNCDVKFKLGFIKRKNEVLNIKSRSFIQYLEKYIKEKL